MGEDVFPHGVSTVSEATGVKPASDCRPVPPITAILMGSGVSNQVHECLESVSCCSHLRTCPEGLSSCGRPHVVLV